MIKADLEFVSDTWSDTCFDLWEEIKGHHLYTRMVQRRALIDGANLALRLGDDGAASWYLKQAKALEPEILRHWNPKLGVLVPTLDRDGGIGYKNSGLDASVILTAMHGDAGDGFLDVTDDRMLASWLRLRETFRALYPINATGPAVAIGRYPEDVYDGGVVPSTREANPWVLLTVGFGEFLYRSAAAFEAKGKIDVTDVNAPFLHAMGWADARMAIPGTERSPATRSGRFSRPCAPRRTDSSSGCAITAIPKGTSRSRSTGTRGSCRARRI